MKYNCEIFMFSKLKIGFATTIIMLMNSCVALQKTAKQELSDGYYYKKSENGRKFVYVDVNQEDINIYEDPNLKLDTLHVPKVYNSLTNRANTSSFSLVQNSFDVDFLTFPLKYRFSNKNVPAQLNANLNGALYLGYRTDVYRISYPKSPLQFSERTSNHFGYSVGFFSGLGNTFVSPTTTKEQLSQEYDGIVWSKGIAGIVAVNNFSIGLALGFDELMDRNKNIWIYNNKPWLGLVFGLNLN